MRLSDNEIRDITRLLEDGKALDEKYRFLLFGDQREVELVWNGKTKDVTNVVLPFQTIEQVDEPRSEEVRHQQGELFDAHSGRQISGWANKLIWGDNRLILSSLKSGNTRRTIEEAGGIKLIYIDPPFSAGLDYSIKVDIGDDNSNEPFVKSPSILEEFAYRNTWGNQGNTFLSMLFERVQLMKDMLSNDGIFFLRIDHHWGHYVKVMLDQVFGKEHFQSEILVNRIKKNVTSQGRLSLPVATDTLFVYFQSKDSQFINIDKKRDKIREGYWRRTDDSDGERKPRERNLFGRVFYPPSGKHFKFNQKRMERMIDEGTLRFNEKLNSLEYYVKPSDTMALDTNWTDIPGYSFTTKYPTENSEDLLERILNISTKEGDIVADFFCGSGTTAAVAEKLGRKWICSDLGKFAIHTTKKRMINVQRQLKKNGMDYRAFEILNLGKYERQHYVGINTNLNDDQQAQQWRVKEQDYLRLILRAYAAESIASDAMFHGKKGNHMVVVGPINLPVTGHFVDEVVAECKRRGIINVDILAFEFEMSLNTHAQEEAKQQGVMLALKYIPRDVFDKKAVERNQVVFHDIAYIEAKPHITGKGKKTMLAIELTGFSVAYNEGTMETAIANLKNGGSTIILERGQLVKISKDTNGICSQQTITKKWSDWIDYWSVDFNYESKPEVILTDGKDGTEMDVMTTGNFIFENEWQSFRTKKNKQLEFITTPIECDSGTRKVAIKVVDIFGNDSMTVIEVRI